MNCIAAMTKTLRIHQGRAGTGATLRSPRWRKFTGVVPALGLLLLQTVRGTPVRAAGEPGWSTHHDVAGFTVRCPAGWIVETARTGRIEVSTAHHSMFALAQPFLLREHAGITAADWINEQAPRFNPPFADARIDIVQPAETTGSVNAAAAKMSFRGPEGKPSQANLVCGIQGTSGILYAIAAPAADFAARRSTLLQVIESLQFAGAKASTGEHASSAGGVRYRNWKDPKEGAFKIDVPVGWKINGGMFRSGPLDIRPYVQAIAPDNQTVVSVGTPGIQIFAPLTPMMARLGWHEGSIYNVGRGQQEFVLNYRSGADFAEGYVKLIVAKDADNLQITEKKDLPMTDGGRKLIAAIYGENATGSPGTVSFTYDKDGVTRAGACFVVTVKPGSNLSTIWGIMGLSTCTSPPAEKAAAVAVAGHMVATFRLDPHWVKTENQVAYATSQDIAREMDNFNKNTARPAENFFAGEVDLVDPSTGEKFHTDAGAATYWRSGATIVGTDGYTRPGIGFTPLKQW